MLSRYREEMRAWTDPVGRVLFRLRLRPNHLTIMGLGVSFIASAAFVSGRTRTGGFLLLLAGLFDFFDGSLARVSGQVTPFGAFLDSVIDRYSDLLVLLGLVVFFASMAERRAALVAMAGLVGSIMVSYTKARAESIGVECNVGFMERPERMICLIAGALFDVLEPALWFLAFFANVTAIHRIAFTRRAIRAATGVGVLAVVAAVLALPAAAADARPPADDTVAAWRSAVEAHQQGSSAALVREFGTEGALKSAIGDYVRWVLADALTRGGSHDQARAVAASIADHHRDSRLAPAGLVMAATLAIRTGDDAGAQKLLARVVERYPDSKELPETLYLLGLVSETRGQRDTAMLAYRELQVLAPASGWADGAGDRLAELARAGVRVPELSMTQRLDRAERLLKSGVAQTAAEEAERIATETSDTPAALRALRIVAEAAQRLGRYELAARALELAVGRAARAQKPALQLEQARLLMRTKQRARALPILATVVSTGSEADASEASYQRARLLDDMGQEVEAAGAYRAVASRYATREVAGAALWRLGWLAYVRGKAREAGEAWSRLGEISGGRTYRIAGLYWAGRAREATGRRADAERLWKKVLAEAPRSYYGILAARRVTATGDGGQAPGIALPADPREAVADDPGYGRVDLLRRVGLLEYAWEELESVVQRSFGDPVRLYGLSGAYVRDERYHLALRILRRHFAALATTGHPSLPQAFWEMLYPFGWRGAVMESARREGLDPFLVAALVREESNYYPRAVSRVGARGLMQLMPGTAQVVAEHRGIALAGTDTLDDPSVNIELGTRFLAGMLKEFRDPRLALAAYNAGPGRVRQWWKARRTDDVEAFVEQIPFDETRGYVKRVMLSWDEYRRLYGK
ncbi:MAG: transglycosylase SLT domain-containing protein [Candidatus Rokubacteria bacterium]|nr:transglycosylase SLT domain-containing protein [Candidatus Rokubacteria bacterium]